MEVRVRWPGKATKRAIERAAAKGVTTGADLRASVTFEDETLALPLRIHLLDVRDDETGERELRVVGCELGERPTNEAEALALPELTALTLRRVVERFPHWVDLARAHAAIDRERPAELGARIKRAHPTRLDPDFYRMVAAEYRRHVEEGEPAPVSAIARSHSVTVGAASRWVKSAREKGYLEKGKEANDGK